MADEWFPMANNLWCHPKLLCVSWEASGLWLRARSYVAHNGSGGEIHRDAIRAFNPSAEEWDRVQELAEQLVSAGLWDMSADGWTFHDFDDYSGKIEKRRQADRERKRKARSGHSADILDQVRPMSAPVRGQNGHVPNVRVPEEKRREEKRRDIAIPNGIDSSIWELWMTTTGLTRRVLDAKRLRAIQRAVKSHGEEEVRDAVRGWVNDPWPERSLHNDVTILLRDATHIEKFANYWRNGPPVIESADDKAYRLATGGKPE